LQLFDKDNAAHLSLKLKKLVALPQFDESTSKAKSHAISAIAIWVRLFYQYIVLVEKIKKQGGKPKGFIPSPVKQLNSASLRKRTVKGLRDVLEN
jgi:hypothetical protein